VLFQFRLPLVSPNTLGLGTLTAQNLSLRKSGTFNSPVKCEAINPQILAEWGADPWRCCWLKASLNNNSFPHPVVAVRDTNPRRCQDSADGLTASYRPAAGPASESGINSGCTSMLQTPFCRSPRSRRGYFS
jgi:hypothetical protein